MQGAEDHAAAVVGRVRFGCSWGRVDAGRGDNSRFAKKASMVCYSRIRVLFGGFSSGLGKRMSMWKLLGIPAMVLRGGFKRLHGSLKIAVMRGIRQ